jgi:enterochelin esterase-like enzyme
MRRRLGLASGLLLALAACGGSEEPGPSANNVAGTSSVAGHGGRGGSAGNGGGAGAALAGTAGSSSTAGANSAAGTAGSGGGSAGSGGALGGGGGGLPAGCVAAGTPGKTGRQCEPDTEGNGTFQQPDPGDGRPDEADGEPEGELSAELTLQSTVYGYGFKYRTYQPTAYQAGKPAALMIFQDGHHYTGAFHAPRVFDRLIEDKSVPVTISVYIEPTGQRSEEYDKRTDKYGKMIMTDLLPELAKSFELVDDPNGWAIAGHSSGGGCAFNVAWLFNDKFRKALTHSATFVNLKTPGNYDYVQIVKDEPKRPIRATLLAGSNDLECCGTTWYDVNNEMSETLEARGYPYRYMRSDTDHGPTKWHTGDFPAAMRWLWKGYTLPHYGP